MKLKNLKKSTIIGYVLSILCLVLCLYITLEVINANTKNRPPRLFGCSVSYVPTESMEPTIDAGEYVFFVQSSFKDIEIDDIVVFRAKDGKYIIHRVIDKNIEEGYLTTKGDNNELQDTDPVTKDMIYGKYVRTLGFMSIFSGGISKNIIFFILVGIFIIMIGMQVFSMVIKNKTEELKKSTEEQKELLREELKKQILEEELQRLKEENKKLIEESNNKAEE